MIVKALATTTVAVGVALVGACSSHAEPEKSVFPDLSGYTPVNIEDYRIDTTTPGIPASTVIFLTPDGIACDFTITDAQCTGNNFPGVPPAVSDPAAGLNRVNWIRTDVGLKQTTDPIAPGDTLRDQPIKTLPPFHSITFNGMICGVDDKKTTACKDPQGHGFVLSPSWSGWLEHV